MSKIRDITGQKFGRLTVLHADGRIRSEVAWVCRCECGAVVRTTKNHMSSGNTQSCGCLAKENSSARAVVHGRYKAPSGSYKVAAFACWKAILKRCLDEQSEDWPRYGGVGITVCEQWMSFENFLADMGDRPSKKHTVDRIDGTKGYEPGNCRWATRRQQSDNRTVTVWVEHDGQKRSIREWSELTGLNYATIKSRIASGWDVGRALTEPTHPNGRRRSESE